MIDRGRRGILKWDEDHIEECSRVFGLCEVSAGVSAPRQGDVALPGLGASQILQRPSNCVGGMSEEARLSIRVELHGDLTSRS